jgi:Rac GTPase-activating protein 1
MPISNLAKVFGPTIVGYSTSEPEPMQMINETKKQAAVCYWYLAMKESMRDQNEWLCFVTRLLETYTIHCKSTGHTPSSEKYVKSTAHVRMAWSVAWRHGPAGLIGSLLAP